MFDRKLLVRVVHIMLAVALFVPSLAMPSPTSAAPAAQGNGPAIHLQAATFVPAAGEQPAIPPGLAIAGYNVNQRGYYIVQFRGPVQQAWKDQVAAQGAEILDYIPDFAFKVRMNPAEADRVAALGEVAWVGIFQPAYKLSPDLDVNGIGVYRVRVERGADAGLTIAAINAGGADVLQRSENLLLVAADAAQLQAVSRVLDVAWIENFVFKQKHNEFGAGVIVGAKAAINNGYDGSTQIAAVADTGLGDGTATGAHPGIDALRIVSIRDWSTGNGRLCYRVKKDGPQDVDSGHGTHVAVSVVGAGDPAGVGKSAAPAARLVFQAVEEYLDIYGACTSPDTPDGYYLIGLPDDLGDLFAEAYGDGARIHANSWGSSQAGVYTLDSANTDAFIWGNPDMTITFSAGNAGADANNNGVVDDDSIGSPATAKNVITVGASENARPDDFPCDTNLGYTSSDPYQTGETCASMGGQNVLGTAGQRWGFTAEPLYSDLTAGNQEQMAPFSSRGPTDDGRIKPDIVAPGTWILSGYSGLYQEGYGDPTNPQNGLFQSDGWGMPFSNTYKYFGGTSMSNPIAAGAATVVRDFYAKTQGHNASAALAKATLINSAVDLLDENNDGINDNAYPIPNVHEGWGRIDLAAATDGSRQFVDDIDGLSTGGSAQYQFDVQTAGKPFKATLVWSDYPSTESASVNLVNDLDLVVTAPSGAAYRGNVFSGGWAQTGGSVDRVNNVENVYVASAAAGTWRVEVSGYNVPNGPQPFALVVEFEQPEAGDTAPTVTITAPAENATLSGLVNMSANADDDIGVNQVEFFVDGNPIGVDSNGTDGWSASWDSIGNEGPHTISATATDTIGQTGSDSINVEVDNIDDAPTVTLTNPADGATVSGQVTLSATADDDGGVTQVEFFVDGGSIGVDSNGDDGWSSGWDSTAVTDGPHAISATATDTIGQTSTNSINVTISNASSPITLSASGYKVKGVQHASLNWSGTTSNRVDIVRDTEFIGTVDDTGSHIDNVGQKGGGSATYQVCEAGTSTCSNQVVVQW